MRHPFTIDALVEERAGKKPESIVFHRENGDTYEPITARQFCIEKRALAVAFVELGISRGDTIGILSAVRYEWELAEKAALSIGCASFGIDVRHSSSEIQQEIEATSIDIIVVEDETLLAQIPASFSNPIILIEKPDTISEKTSLHIFSDLVKQHIGKKPHIHADREDWAVIIPTSGTTGEPKLIRYKNHQIIAACMEISDMLDLNQKRTEPGVTICWLPLIYMTSRIMNLVDYATGGSVYFLKNPKQIVETLPRIHPTHFLSVPIFYERVYKGLFEKQEQLRFFTRVAFKFIIAVRTHTSIDIAPRTIRLIREKIFGKRLEFAISGSAPISIEILKSFKALSIDIFEAYALSENAIPISINTPNHHKMGSVGKLCKRNTVRFARDGEILVKGEGIFEGYLHSEHDTEALFDGDGYLKTGDIGYQDDDGFLHITGRKKNIIKTANGYRISPTEIEAVYGAIPYIKQIVVVGDNQKFLGALIVLDTEQVKTYLGKHTISYTSPEMFPLMEEVKELIMAECMSRRKLLAIYKQIKVFALLQRPFTVEKGELTENFKIRRNVIITHYQKEIDDMYQNAL